MNCFLRSPSLIVWSWVMHPPMHCRALFKSWARCQSICKRAGEPSSPDQLRYFSATAATQNFPRAPLSASRAEKWLFGEIQPRVDPQEAGQQCDVMMMMKWWRWWEWWWWWWFDLIVDLTYNFTPSYEGMSITSNLCLTKTKTTTKTARCCSWFAPHPHVMLNRRILNLRTANVWQL